MKKNVPPDAAHELRDSEVPIVRGAASDSCDTLRPGASNAPTQTHN